MCATCGCAGEGVTITDPEHAHSHDHCHGDDHGHGHGHGHEHVHDHPHPHEIAGQTLPAMISHSRTVQLEQDVLAKNDLQAARNRGWLEGKGIAAVNLMSSPGSGKTTVLERTVREMGQDIGVSVIEGDQETVTDAERIKATGARAIQVNTGSGCHLDADMLSDALRTLEPPDGSVVFVENVGNLVCPALFDLGESRRVVIMSVTEGEDKPLKYPHMFRTADLLLLNKVDLLPHLTFDVNACIAGARRINPDLEVLCISATSGEGMTHWYDWLRCVSEGWRGNYL